MSEPAFTLANRLALSVEEAAQALGVSEAHLRALLPELPHVHLGRRVVIPVDSLRAWLRERAETEGRRVDRAVDEILSEIGSDRIKAVR